jgi:D-3-phosphoglycerate dehydrogenase
MLRAGAKIDRTKILGVEMWRKTVGVIGMGNIGSRVARKWQGAFEAKILFYDPYVKAAPYEKIQKLEDLLKASDLVSIHVPLTDETRKMIGAPQLALMKSTAVLVNTSRGGIIDEAALYDALKAGRLFAAGLDVWEVEPPPKDAPLLSLANVVGTPHAAGGTFDTQERSSLQVAMQVVEVLQGKPPQNRVN